MKPKLSESDITKQIRDVLRHCRIFHWKQWQGPMSQPKGVSDILGWKTVRVSDLVDAGVEKVAIPIAIEVKKEGWAPPGPETKAYEHFKRQEDFLFQVREGGGIGFFAASPEEVIDRLDLQAKLTPLFCKTEATS